MWNVNAHDPRRFIRVWLARIEAGGCWLQARLVRGQPAGCTGPVVRVAQSLPEARMEISNESSQAPFGLAHLAAEPRHQGLFFMHHLWPYAQQCVVRAWWG